MFRHRQTGSQAQGRTIAERFDARTTIIVNFLAIAGALLAFYLWFDGQINKVIEQRVEPYENFLVGLAFVEDEEYEKAIPELDKAFDQLKMRFSTSSTSSEKILPVFDYYLYAIANSEDPSDYSNKYNKIINLIQDGTLSPNAYHYYQIGIYYFRTGNIEEAKTNLNRSAAGYNIADQFYSASHVYWAMAIVALSEGDLDGAIMQLAEASRRNPGDYDPRAIALNTEVMTKDAWYRRVVSLYPEYSQTLPQFFVKIEELNSIKSSS
jgi:tetratricopeptide (TPR) repeat protein